MTFPVESNFISFLLLQSYTYTQKIIIQSENASREPELQFKKSNLKKRKNDNDECRLVSDCVK